MKTREKRMSGPKLRRMLIRVLKDTWKRESARKAQERRRIVRRVG